VSAPWCTPAVALPRPWQVVAPADGVELLRPTARPRTTHVLVFDTETTGREHDARIVEIAVARVRLSDGCVVKGSSWLVDPGARIPAEASAVHGVYDRDVRGKPSVGEVLPVILRAAVASGLVMVAHNASFDLARLRYEAQRTDVALPGMLSVYCSLKAARKLKAGRGAGLQVLREHYRVTAAGDAHRAMGDVAVLAAVLPHLLREPGAQGRDFRECFPLEAML
jgi:DNA polymerase III epsilon subunit-like protein